MKKILLSFLLLVVLAGLGFTLYSSYAYRTALDYPETTLILEPRTGAKETLEQLHAAGLAPPLAVMALPVILSNQYSQLKAGEYQFLPGLTPAQIIGQIARGDVVIHKVTIPEGWNSYQLRAALMAEPLLTGELPAMIPEGSALPDTMHFSRGEARSSVLARMQKAQAETLAKLWEERAANAPVNTPEEALILASVIEKETGVAAERELVSGVFANRLRQGMMLQSDPTVVYGVEAKQGGAPMNRLLSRKDLATDTPYNSYTRTGLPPTPICHPGKEAIRAALHPAATDAFYFVATGSGGHHFAATLAEHEKNVKLYRAALREQEPEPAVVKPVAARKGQKTRQR